jgi:hemoglobin/transferrin/lactoferrin receptor protein
MTKLFSIIAILISFFAFSQNVIDTTKTKQLGEVTLNSERYSKSKNSSSQQIETISKKEIEFQNFQSTAEMLSNSGTLAVQKSQQGGGSPIIRGFESSRILLLVDGIRMNNLIFRGGHLQNVITVDENMLENADVLFGSASTAYGSDALGGVINLRTKNAKLLSNFYSKKFSTNFNTRYSSVNQEKSGYLDFGFSRSNWATLTAFSYNDFGDLKMGSRKNGDNDFFGERTKYIETNNGVDTIIDNPNPLIQKFSGYRQYNATQKMVFSPRDGTSHNLNLQFSTTTDIPRYDRLTDLDSKGKLKTATWNYGPQKRILAAYKFSKENAFLNSDLTVNGSYQNIEESRITRNFGKEDETSRVENVTVYGINIDLKKKFGRGDFLYGLDFFYDDLKSTAYNLNIKNGTRSSASTRYPDGKNYTYKTEVFATYFSNINEKTTFNFGARFGYNSLHSEIKEDPLKIFYAEIDQKNITYSAATGLVNQTTEHLKFAVNLSTGFRAPNIDDLSKIFESNTADKNLIVPNNNLKPEKTITADISGTLFDNEFIVLENTLFYTRLFDAIVTDAFLLNGQSQVLFDGTLSNVTANQNLGQGSILGFSSSLKSKITKHYSIYGTFNFTEGKLDTPTGKKPLDHISPVFGKAGMSFENKWLNLDLSILYNGKKLLKDYSDSGEDNAQYAPTNNGTPSWKTYNFKMGIKPFKALAIYSGVENILDVQYRTFASGINAPGRNIYFGAKYSL